MDERGEREGESVCVCERERERNSERWTTGRRRLMSNHTSFFWPKCTARHLQANGEVLFQQIISDISPVDGERDKLSSSRTCLLHALNKYSQTHIHTHSLKQTGIFDLFFTAKCLFQRVTREREYILFYPESLTIGALAPALTYQLLCSVSSLYVYSTWEHLFVF